MADTSAPPASPADPPPGRFAPLPTREAFLAAPRKAIGLFGMSGVGKTRLAEMLRASGLWYHYSVDYRIGTRYLGEHIVDLFKQEAMGVPLLRELLLSDSVRLSAKIAFKNLAPLTAYLGKPGAVAAGGLPLEEYLRRQRQHRTAEVSAMLDTLDFRDKAEAIYGYPNFLCDTSGSLVEVVDPDDPEDRVMTALTPSILFVFIEGEATDTDELCRRFEHDPKPMYYDERFLTGLWETYRAETGQSADAVDPDAFARWGFRRLVDRRAPRYRAIADRWGVTVPRRRLADVSTEAEMLTAIAEALPTGP